jgi:hypothetical protein
MNTNRVRQRLIRRGDLLLSNAKREEQKDFMFRFQEKDERKLKVPIYEYPDDDDDIPERFETGQNGESSTHQKYAV